MPRAAHALTPDFSEETVVIRGVSYRLRELSIGDYEDLVKKATTTKSNPMTGEEDEQVDNALLLKLMVIRCSVAPKLTAETLSNLPMRVVLKLNQTVNKMHYGDEPESKPTEDEEVSEEESKGND